MVKVTKRKTSGTSLLKPSKLPRLTTTIIRATDTPTPPPSSNLISVYESDENNLPQTTQTPVIVPPIQSTSAPPIPGTSKQTPSIEVIDISDDEPEVIDIADDNTQPTSSRSFIETMPTVQSEPIPAPAVPTLHNQSDHSALVNWILVEDNGVTKNDFYHRTEKKAVFKVEHNLNNFTNIMDFKKAINEAFSKTMKAFLAGHDPEDKFTAYIENTSPDHPVKPLFIPPRKIEPFDDEAFLNRVSLVHQSNANLLLDGLLKVRVAIYSSLTGSASCTSAPQTYERIIKKGSVIAIKNTDTSCGFRAITLGIMFHGFNQNHSDPSWQSLVKHPQTLDTLTDDFCRNLNLDLSKPLNIYILDKIQQKLKHRFQFIMLDFKTGSLLYTGVNHENKIYLLFSRYTTNGHYDFIKSITGYFNRKFYCLTCNIPYQRPTNHRCPGSCYLCRATPKCEAEPLDSVTCTECNIAYVNSACFQKHIEIKICKLRKRCEQCEVIYIVNKNHPHKCGEFKCFKCKEYYTIQPHYCYIKPLKPEDLAKDDLVERIFVAFDVESMLIKSNNVTQHIPIQLCASITCDNCWDGSWMEDNCPHCLKANMFYYGKDCVVRFNNYVLNVLAKKAAGKKWQVLVVAHNLSSYDGHWVLRDLMERNLKNIIPVMKGNKIMKVDVGNVRYIDTLLFFQQPLSALPKCFGLQESAKGFFPHFRNTPENQELEWYIRDIHRDEFGYKSMKAKIAEEFKTWYDLHKDEKFNLKVEMENYCANDVKILLQSLMKFRELFKKATEIDPFKRCFTLASVALEYFRAKHLPENQIGVTPIEGYGSKRKQSIKGNAFLDTCARLYNTPIKTEYKQGPHWVDGFINVPTVDYFDGNTYDKIAFEFLGKLYLYK